MLLVRDNKRRGKIILDDNGDGAVDVNDWGNRLYYALPGRGSSYFLASAGVDGMFNCLPPDPDNEDNVLHLEDYND